MNKRSNHGICMTCRFWDKANTRDSGVCRRYPPKIYGHVAVSEYSSDIDTTDIHIFPETGGDDWCGEYRSE